MIAEKFEIIVDGVLYASDMNIETAIILVKGLFNEYYNDLNMIISVKRMEVKEWCLNYSWTY